MASTATSTSSDALSIGCQPKSQGGRIARFPIQSEGDTISCAGLQFKTAVGIRPGGWEGITIRDRCSGSAQPRGTSPLDSGFLRNASTRRSDCPSSLSRSPPHPTADCRRRRPARLLRSLMSLAILAVASAFRWLPRSWPGARRCIRTILSTTLCPRLPRIRTRPLTRQIH